MPNIKLTFYLLIIVVLFFYEPKLYGDAYRLKRIFCTQLFCYPGHMKFHRVDRHTKNLGYFFIGKAGAGQVHG